jgi:molybdopterin/thiamine biosynthesis adenylyltransferase
MTTNLNLTRHLSLLDPTKLKSPIHIIGVGAVGSKIAMSLAKLGITDIHIYDFDKIEEHNISNQLFGLQHIAKSKVDATKEIVKEYTGIELHAHDVKVEAGQEFEGIVFFELDTMSGRKMLLDNCQWKPQIKLCIDTRMGADIMEVFSFNPCIPEELKQYRESLTDDDIADVSYCGSAVSVGPTSSILAELAVWNLIKWFNLENPQEHAEAKERDNSIPFKITFSLRPMYLGQKIIEKN